MADDKEVVRVNRGKARAELKRSTAIASIRAVHALALRVSAEPSLIPELLSAASDLDSWWAQFKSEDDSVLDHLVLLDRANEYVPGLTAEVRALFYAAKVIADQFAPKVTEHADCSHIDHNSFSKGPFPPPQTQPIHNDASKPLSRLPEIPLPLFEGDYRYWPTFRDRFTSLVDDRSNLTTVDKMYYLIGCLRGVAADIVRGIPLCADNYELVWSTLSTRFNRPRMVATSLVDDLMRASSFNQESLSDLNNFLCTFSEGISLLNALKIPDMSSFILFSVAFRCLPMSTRKLFESSTTADFPSIEELLTFVQSRVSILEIVGDSRKPTNVVTQSRWPQSGQSGKGGERSRKPVSSTLTSLVTSKSSEPCPCCSGPHEIGLCTRFKSWPVEERLRWVRDKRLCFICFSAEHWVPKCRSKIHCHVCKHKHHHLLHVHSDESRVNEDPSRVEASLCASATPLSKCKSNVVVLGTALVHVRDRSGSWQTMRALIDCASQISAVTVASADRLGLKRTRWTAPVLGLSGVPIINVQGRATCTVQPRFATEPALSINAWVLPSITNDLPRDSLPTNVRERYSSFALADPSFDTPAPIDLLLGGDVYASIMDGPKVVVDKDLPVAFSSIFGWVLIGPVVNDGAASYRSLPVSLTVSIEGLMEQFWRAEEPEDAPATFTEEGQCESIFCKEHVRLPSGRFSVPLPFRRPVSDAVFAGSRAIAERRFDSLERKLLTNPSLKASYIQFMSEYVSLGHMSIAESPGCNYIPHHAVCRPDDDNKKIRVVFDASAQHSSGPSLNNCLLPGPKLQQDILDILMRFRVHSHAFTADICKMYRQIQVLPEYRKYQRILWRESPHHELRDYELHTVTYGVNCAPFLALRVLKAIASEDCEGAESVRYALTHQTYVDDICVGADSENAALDLQSNLISVLSRSGMELKKWASNTPSVLAAVPVASRGSGPLPFDAVDGSWTKVLGIEWQPENDYFCCALRVDSRTTFTKRGILSLVARIFDPLGLFGPATFLAKTIMQRTWQCGLGWDVPLPEDIKDEWAAFVKDLPALLTIQVPRYINAYQNAPCQLLGFCDASRKGYAAVVYARLVGVPSGDRVFLLGTKTKLAPLKELTVPRLELNAALLLARWLGRIRRILESRLNITDTCAWSDSTIVLSWLTGPHESFKTYVSNRVHHIRTLLPECKWHHIDSVNNPADCASRGIMPSELARLSLYWNGPQLIYGDSANWIQIQSPLSIVDLPEIRPISCTVQVDEVPAEWFNRFSSYDRMIRVVARMRRFIARCRRGGLDSSCTPVYLRKTELDVASRVLIIESQRVHFSSLRHELASKKRVSSKPLAKLAPFIDSDGVIRVGGRLRHSGIDYNCKHPILLAKGSHLALLLCERWHKLTCHSGPRVITALISAQYWVVSLRTVLHKVLSRCSVCVRLNAKPLQPFMADLPAARVQQCRPFTHIGIDYAGPLQLRELQLRKSRTFKIYIAVFICFAVKAVHLEVVTGLSTEAFLAAFDRFVARRGLPNHIYSDCGTNFVGADKRLRDLIHSPTGQAAIANSRTACEWHFNPPGAPHFGGLWEAAIRSAKRLLVRVIGTHTYTYEEFTTVLARIEAVLNSRPLTPASSDPHDLECLTPGHFLIGQPLLAIPPKSPPETTRRLANRFTLLDQCHQAFWRRWTCEYLTTLQERSKWTNQVPNLNVNDMVVVVDNQSPPLVWRLGRVIELLPGDDGVVRVARVLTRTGDITRPVVKLVPLPVE